MKVVGLFAGIGGIELGLERAGHETLLLCENDPGARAVLQTHFPSAPVHDDVSTLGALPEDTELLAAGFPCQDLSQAGSGSGIGGERSGLVRHVFRLLQIHRVPWVLIENVPFMLQLDRGAAMDYLVTRLEELGYRWAYRIVDSRAFGLPQRRRRVYLLAAINDRPEEILFAEDACEPEEVTPEGRACGFYWTEGTRGLGWTVDAVPTIKGGSGVGIPSPPAIWFPDGRIVTPDIRDAERLQGFDADWTLPAESAVRASYRWKLVGNAVSVPAAEWVGEALAAMDRRELVDVGPHMGAWPAAAFGSESKRFKAHVSEWPVRRARLSLERFLKEEPRPLSARATAGFFSRLEASSLRYPEDFANALKRHLELLEGRKGFSQAESEVA